MSGLRDIALRQITNNLHRSLADTFLLMFQMDVVALSDAVMSDSDKYMSSSIDLVGHETDARLTFAADRALIEQICHNLFPSSTPVSQEICQDTNNEIANIIANSLRTYIFDKLDLTFLLSLPYAGAARPLLKSGDSVSLAFNAPGDKGMFLTFSTARSI